MAFGEGWDENKPSGATQRGYEIDDEVVSAKVAIRERLEGDAADDLTGLIVTGSFAAAPKPKMGAARIHAVVQASIAGLSVEIGRMAFATDNKRLYHLAAGGAEEIGYARIDGSRAHTGDVDMGGKTFTNLVFAATLVDSGVFADARVQESNVTAHEAALAIDWSQLTSVPTDLAGYGITDAAAAVMEFSGGQSFTSQPGNIYMGLAELSTSENTAKVLAPFAGTLKNMYVRLQTAPGAGEDQVVTLRKNAAGSALTTTIANAAKTGNDTAHTVAVAAGDELAIEFNGSAGVAGTFATVSLELVK